MVSSAQLRKSLAGASNSSDPKAATSAGFDHIYIIRLENSCHIRP